MPLLPLRQALPGKCAFEYFLLSQSSMFDFIFVLPQHFNNCMWIFGKIIM